VTDLGTLPGGHEGFALSITGRGQVAGFGSNGRPDKYSFFAGLPGVWHTQTRSFIWRNGKMHDIGSLGGPDTLMNWQNPRGEITGQSYTDDTANTATGTPTQDPFRWDNGHMRNLGTLGGTVGFGNWINGSGKVVGCSDLAGDRVSRPFLWNGRRMRNLGSLGGPTGCANWISDSGIVAGYALTASNNFHGFLWRNGRMQDLKPLGGAPWSFANSVNDSGIVVGRETDTKFNELFAVLWNRGRAYNLNKLIAPARLRLTSAEYISNNGDIVGNAILPNGDRRVFLLIRNHSVPLPAVSWPGLDGTITPRPEYTMRVAADTTLPAALRWLLRLNAMRRVTA
jgi:probable HAF family extracellular repeat protein